MILAEELKSEILGDEYFLRLFKCVEKLSAYNLFQIEHDNKLSEKEYYDLMSFADILSHSEDSQAKNKAYKIVALLSETYGNQESFKTFATAILSKLGNFPGLSFLERSYGLHDYLPIERAVEKKIKEESQKTSDGKSIFTDAQFLVRQDLDKYDYFSFSGPTSIGKSFILKDFLRDLLGHKDSINGSTYVILVPTRALISQVVSELRHEIDNLEVNIASHPTLSEYAIRKYRQHIFVFTPERLLTYISANNSGIKYLFVDEAHKVIAPNDSRSSLYYHAIYETSRRFATKLVFASPNIPNPDVFLKLFQKDDKGALSVNEQTVSQNRYFVNLLNKEVLLFSELGGYEKLEKLNINSIFTSDELIKKLGSNVSNIVYCNGVSETVRRAKRFADSLNVTQDKAVLDVMKFASQYVHKDYYLIECLKKGVAFHHGRMPQKIRRKVEELFKDKNSKIKYVFCTSTLLEGINLPAKNIFILNEGHGSHSFQKIDFENLIGRAGRLTKEFAGNVICVKDDQRRWSNINDLIAKTNLPQAESFIINTEKKRKAEFLNIGKALTNKKLSTALNVGEKENITHYASVVLLHHIENAGSVLRSNFLAKNPTALDILNKVNKSNKVPSEILRLSSTIRPHYQNQVFDHINKHGRLATLRIDIENSETVVKTLEILYDLYNWGEEESHGRDPLIPGGLVKKGYGKSRLRYWAMLLKNWTKSEPLNRLISFSIQHHAEKGDIWFYEDGKPNNEKFTGSQKQINIIIEQIMNDIENGLRFKIEKYFYNYYLLTKHIIGESDAGPNWAEFIEYGTLNRQMIELQNVGFSRGAARFLLTKYISYFTFDVESKLIAINEKSLLENIEHSNEYYEEISEISVRR